ncbi:hypothetical protein AVEN_35652-1 [Araneus ventricosus]|uniref:Uncharacterized protein n=1 Tax=Araneus ventricosus TaxID=182803 RepID=A0A4Y2RNA7_ARAVE|nr:hypothetical protein AVEN_35652-1 [Araneus ventricosus]
MCQRNSDGVCVYKFAFGLATCQGDSVWCVYNLHLSLATCQRDLEGVYVYKSLHLVGYVPWRFRRYHPSDPFLIDMPSDPFLTDMPSDPFLTDMPSDHFLTDMPSMVSCPQPRIFEKNLKDRFTVWVNNLDTVAGIG